MDYECGYDGDRPLPKAGVSIERVLVDKDGGEVGTLTIPAKDCGL